MEKNEGQEANGTGGVRVDRMVRQPIGFVDKNGKEICEGDRLHVIKRMHAPITDGWGRGDFGSALFVDDYHGHVFYDPSRAEFRVDDERFGDRNRSRNLYEFNEIEVA